MLAPIVVAILAVWSAGPSSASTGSLAAPKSCAWRAIPENLGGGLELYCRRPGRGWKHAPTPYGFNPNVVAEAEAGEPGAMIDMGLFYSGEGPTYLEDDKAALDWWRKSADKGDSRAMVLVAMRYSQGQGVKKAPAQAAFWMRKAAEAGNPLAMWLYGTWCENGVNVTQNSAEAGRWYRLGAEHGEIGSMFSLSHLYRDGVGVPKDPALSARWERAAEAAQKAEETRVNAP